MSRTITVDTWLQDAILEHLTDVATKKNRAAHAPEYLHPREEHCPNTADVSMDDEGFINVAWDCSCAKYMRGLTYDSRYERFTVKQALTQFLAEAE